MSEAPPPSSEERPSAAAPSASGAAGAGLKLMLELGPILLFLWCLTRYDIFVATGVFMVAIIISLVVTRVREKRWPAMTLVSAVLVLVFGGLTIWLHDDTFIKIKITILNAAFGLALVVAMLLRRPLIKLVLGEALHLTDEGWATLTKLWAGYFLFVAALNELVWRNTSTVTWGKFKLGLIALSFLFAIAQAPVIAKHDLSERKVEPEVDSDA